MRTLFFFVVVSFFDLSAAPELHGQNVEITVCGQRFTGNIHSSIIWPEEDIPFLHDGDIGLEYYDQAEPLTGDWKAVDHTASGSFYARWYGFAGLWHGTIERSDGRLCTLSIRVIG